MNKKLNKLVTNYPVELTEEEIGNLSGTLAPVVAACGGGGGGTGGKIYTGAGFVNVNNTTNQISLTEDANEKLNEDYVTYVEYSTQIAKFYTKNQVNNLLDEKQDTLKFEYDEDNKVSAINGSALAGQGGTTYTPGQYINIDSNNEISVTGLVAIDEYATYSGDWNDVSNSYKTNSGSFLTSEDLTSYSTIEHADNASANAFNEATALIPDVSNFITKDVNDLTNYYPKTETSSVSELQAKFGSLLDYDVVTGNSAVLITTADANNTRTFTISLTATPTAADTVLNGQNGVDATLNGNVWNVGLSQSSYNAVNNVQNKLDTTAAAQTYQPKGNYVSSTDISDMATQTWVGNQGYLTQVPSEYVTDTELQTTLDDYATKTLVQNTSAAITALIPSTAGLASESDLQIVSAGVDYVSANAITAHQSLTNYYTKDETSGANELSTALGNIWSNFDEYALKSEIPTVPTKVSDLTDSANYYKTTETSSKNELSTEFAKYVTSSNVTTQDTDYVMTTTGWKVLTLPGGGMTQVIHDETLTGQGNDANSKLGVAWSALSGYTIASSNSATWATKAMGNHTEYSLGSTLDTMSNITATIDRTLMSMTGYNGIERQIDDITDYASAFGLTNTAYAAIQYVTANSGDWDNVSAKLDTTAAAQTYQTKGDYVKNTDIGLDANNKVTAISGKELIITAHQSLTNYYTKSETSGATEISTALGNKVDKPSSLVNKYLVLRTNDAGNVSGWCDFQDQSYSKTEALGTFVATANIDSTTLSGDGKSVSTKLGVKTDVIATRDYVNDSFLPTSGGTVSGQLVVSGDGTFDQENLKFIRSGLNGYGRIGLASNGALAVKVDDSNSNTTQINVAANASYNELIQVQHGGTTAYLIPAVTSTTTAGLTNDGILHIIVES